MRKDQPVPVEILDEMTAYYRARAPEYDAWFAPRKDSDPGPVANAPWFAEVGPVVAALNDLAMTGDVVDLAAGSGIWTSRLLRTATSVTAVDLAPEMLALNRERVNDDRVRYVLADLFRWSPDRIYDGVCVAFWLSHVPRERLNPFLRMVSAALRPGGKIFFVDSHSRQPASSEGSQVLTRRLSDGRTFRVVKNRYAPAEIKARCAAAGLTVTVQETASVFQFGVGARM